MQLGEDFVALFGILCPLVIARELIDLLGKLCGLHTPCHARVQCRGRGAAEHHLRAQRLPQRVDGIDRRIADVQHRFAGRFPI